MFIYARSKWRVAMVAITESLRSGYLGIWLLWLFTVTVRWCKMKMFKDSKNKKSFTIIQLKALHKISYFTFKVVFFVSIRYKSTTNKLYEKIFLIVTVILLYPTLNIFFRFSLDQSWQWNDSFSIYWT